MYELPESYAAAKQVKENLAGKKITHVIVGASPHKFAWYYGDRDRYDKLLSGRSITGATHRGGFLEIDAEGVDIFVSEGATPRYYEAGAKLPPKHQLLLEFSDGSHLAASVQMYGGIGAVPHGEMDNPYYLGSVKKPSPLTDAFNEKYFLSLLAENYEKLSAKAFLATEQRVPGLGNGVLQDILFHARINPRTKMGSLSNAEISAMFGSVKKILADMASRGGRDVEKDLFGNPGGYACILSSNTYRNPCPVCGSEIVKEAYLGGSVYYCPVCQPCIK